MLSKNLQETEKIVTSFLDKIFKQKNKHEGALIVALSGDLGAGKTAFTQAAGKYLGIKNKIISPTFVILKKYLLKHKDYKFFFHIDAYRLKNEKELLRLGWEEIIKDKNNLVFIEWPERVSKIIPSHTKSVNIIHVKNGQRKLEVK